jgi:adenylate cyclase
VTAFHLTRRDLRLASGLTLFAYVAAHLVNHALGLISIDAAERGLRAAVAVWHSPPGTFILYGAALMHVSLALLAVYEHRTLRMPPLELLRIALGLGIPTLLIGHAIATRLAFELYAHPPDYAHVVWSLWNSGRQGLQIALLVPGWLHGCLGLNYAFGRRSWFRRVRLPLFGAALLLPTLAVLGFLSMVKEVSLRAEDPSWLAATIGPVDGAQRLALGRLRDGAVDFWFATIVAVLLARLVRRGLEERRGALVSIRYPGRTVRVPRGWSVLEASRSHRIAHVSMCGGRARCSTCRVRVLEGQDHCSPIEDSERETLARIGAAADTRLACQLRPQGDVSVVPLLTAAPGARPSAGGDAEEREITVLLVDFHCERPGRPLLPHDLLYALDRFGDAVGEMARAAGGATIQFTGDRALVLFGSDVVASEARRQALGAASSLARRLDALSTELHRALGCESSHVVFVHAGTAAIGRIGDRSRRALAAVGGAIDVVRRLAAWREQHAVALESIGVGVFVTRAALVDAPAELAVTDWQRWSLPGEARIEVARIASSPESVLESPRESSPSSPTAS